MTVPTHELLTLMRQRANLCDTWRRKLEGSNLKVLEITYEEMTGGERAEARAIRPNTADKLCRFLKVPVKPLRAPTRKVNAYPLWLLVKNWDEVRDVVEQTEFKHCLGLEEKWQEVDGVWIIRT